jgi:hypothetical protein
MEHPHNGQLVGRTVLVTGATVAERSWTVGAHVVGLTATSRA